MSDTRFVFCRVNGASLSSSFKLHIRFVAHGSDKGMQYFAVAHGLDKGMQSTLIKDYCLFRSTSRGMLTTVVSSKSATKKDGDMGELISDDLDMRILNEAMKTYSCEIGFLLNRFRKTMVQTRKFDEMLEGQRIMINNVLNLAIDAIVSQHMELKFLTLEVLCIVEVPKSDSVPTELLNFGEKENIKDKENRPKKVVTLPDHLILDQILPRLPVKSLLRFKSVCRDWCSTISTPEFEKSRLAFSGSHHQFVFLRDDEYFSPSSINNPNYLIIRENYKYKNEVSAMIGCCNGLVGFITKKSDGVRNFIVLNPATRQQVEILGPDEFRYVHYWYWFGYVSSVDDYYIVAFYGSDNAFWTFSWKAGIWKRNLCISNKTEGRFRPLKTPGIPALINDSLYWPTDVCWDPFVGVGTEIVVINLVTEKYEIKPQINLAQSYPRLIFLVNLEGCLAMHTASPKGRLDVWMLRQAGDWNSWEQVYSQVIRHCRLIYYSTTGKLLVRDMKQLKSVDDLSQLEPEEQEVNEDTKRRMRKLGATHRGVGDYVESMTWPF